MMKRKLLTVFMCVACVLQTWAHDFEVDGIYYNKINDNEVEVTYRGDYENIYSGDIILPESIEVSGVKYLVTSIGKEAFYESEELTSITFPNSIKKISTGAFAYCTKLKSLSIPDFINEVEEGFIFGCSQLTTIDINKTHPSCIFENGIVYNKTKSLLYAFLPINQAISFSIPNTVTQIGMGAFLESSLQSITIPSSVTRIGDAVFFDCKDLKTIEIPNTVIELGESAFYGCRSLKSVKLPEAISKIGEATFAYCYELTSINIPSTVKEIGEWAFFLGKLNHIYVNWNEPLSISNHVFGYNGTFDFPECTLYVPKGTKSLYEKADVWKEFGNIVEWEGTNIDTPESKSTIYISGNTLYVNTPVAETISVYSIKGELLYSFEKSAGEAYFPLGNRLDTVLIVKISSGESKKIINSINN